MGHYEIVALDVFGNEGRRLGIVSASDRNEAVRKLQRKIKLPSNIRVYPVNLS